MKKLLILSLSVFALANLQAQQETTLATHLQKLKQLVLGNTGDNDVKPQPTGTGFVNRGEEEILALLETLTQKAGGNLTLTDASLADINGLLNALNGLKTGSLALPRLTGKASTIYSTIKDGFTKLSMTNKLLAANFIGKAIQAVVKANIQVPLPVINPNAGLEIVKGLVTKINALYAEVQQLQTEDRTCSAALLKLQHAFQSLLQPLQALIFELQIPKAALQDLLQPMKDLQPALQNLILNLDFPVLDLKQPGQLNWGELATQLTTDAAQ